MADPTKHKSLLKAKQLILQTASLGRKSELGQLEAVTTLYKLKTTFNYGKRFVGKNVKLSKKFGTRELLSKFEELAGIEIEKIVRKWSIKTPNEYHSLFDSASFSSVVTKSYQIPTTGEVYSTFLLNSPTKLKFTIIKSKKGYSIAFPVKNRPPGTYRGCILASNAREIPKYINKVLKSYYTKYSKV